MPYRRKGTRVEVKKGGKWRVLKSHPNEAKAKAHLRALQGNVKKHGGYGAGGVPGGQGGGGDGGGE